MRECRQRMPVPGMDVSEGPGCSRESESFGNLWIFVDVAGVIVVDEVVTKGLAKNEPGERRQENANQSGFALQTHVDRWRRSQRQAPAARSKKDTQDITKAGAR